MHESSAHHGKTGVMCAVTVHACMQQLYDPWDRDTMTGCVCNCLKSYRVWESIGLTTDVLWPLVYPGTDGTLNARGRSEVWQ